MPAGVQVPVCKEWGEEGRKEEGGGEGRGKRSGRGDGEGGGLGLGRPF